MIKKQALLVVLILFMTGMLTACGGTDPAAPQAPAQGAAEDAIVNDAVEASAAEEQITLTIWAFEGESDDFITLIEGFEAKHPNIKVEVVDIPESEYTTKIDTALIAGEPPDLGFIYEPKWIAAGHFLPIAGTLKEAGINVEDYNEGAMAANCLVEGEVYCIGTSLGAIIMFYNKDAFDAAGVDYPSSTVPMTIDEYVDMAESLTKEGETPADSVWGADADIGVWWQDWRNFIGEDGRKVEGYVNDAATVHAFEKLVETRNEGTAIWASSAISAEGTGSADLLASGQLATSIIDNVLAIPMLENTDIRWGAALVPVEEKGDEPWTTTWTDGYGIFSKSDHPEAAMAFITYLATEGNTMRLQNGIMPLNMTFGEEWAGERQGRQEVLQVLAVARPNLFVPGYWDVIGPLWDAYEGDMLEDGRSAQEVLDEYAPIMQETLNQAWETWDSFQE